MIKLSAEHLLGPLNDVEKKYAPDVLYVAGSPAILSAGPRVSIVGSRRTTEDKLQAAGTLTARLVRHGVVIVSGLAEGIDAAAHVAAINSGGHTIAVLGTSLDQYYPRKHRALQDLIMREQLAVSQFHPSTPTRPRNFPLRNRTMALMSHATIIVDAGETSGTKHQGWEALRLGRSVFFASDLVDAQGLEWPRDMMLYGAAALDLENLDESLWDVVDLLPFEPGAHVFDVAV